MKKRICAIILLLVMLAMIPVTVSATSNDLSRVIDQADLLSAEEEMTLANTIAELQSGFGLDVVIVTAWDLGEKSAQEYADDYYDEHGYGYGEDASGILFLLAMGTREWYMSTCGDAIYIFTDYALDEMGNAIVPYLSDGRYFDAFDRWLREIPYYCDAYQNGHSIDGYVPPDVYSPVGGEQIIYPEYSTDTSSGENVISVIVGFLVALVTILIMRGKMNTAKLQSGAAEYMKKDSYDLISRRDMYLYSHVSKTAKPQNNGGGSSVHRSSGGHSHGGRGGRF